MTVKNRVFRSNVSGRFDNYDGSGNQARINWETKFAKGGVGAIISSFVPVHLRGRIVPNSAMIDDDRHIPFWRIRRRIDAFSIPLHAELVVYCGHGPRALVAGRALRRKGFTRIQYLEGHFSRWRSVGFREER